MILYHGSNVDIDAYVYDFLKNELLTGKMA